MFRTHRLVNLLQLLTPKEAQRFSEWLESPFFNKNKRLCLLWNALKEHHPLYQNVPKDDLIKRAFDVALSDNYFRDLLTDLTRQVEQFLVYLLNEEQLPNKRFLLLEALLQRGGYDLFEKYGAKVVAEKSTELNEHQSSEQLYEQYQIEWLWYQHTTLTNNRAVNSNLPAAIEHFDWYYITEKLRMEVLQLNRQNVVAGNYKPNDLFNELMQKLTHLPPEQMPILARAYYFMANLFRQPEPSNWYEELKQLLSGLKNEPNISPNERQQLYILLSNYCRLQFTRTGNLAYAHEALGLSKSMLAEGILYSGQYMSAHQFRNMVLLGILTKQFDWVREFMQRYKLAVAPEYRNNVHRFNLASLHFAVGNYRKAQEALRDIQFSGSEFIDVYYHLSYKTLLIKTYYETQEHEALLSSLEALRIYLTRNQAISARNREAYKNFIKLTAKLMNLPQKQTTRRQNLSDLIARTTVLVEHEWLLEKIKAV